MKETSESACGCDSCAWKDDLIVELQHQIRELQHELETERLVSLGWPIGVTDAAKHSFAGVPPRDPDRNRVGWWRG